jgi:arsenate reductase (glutaredoxin)
MAQWKIYHNPKCSKSREALSLLQARGVELEVIRSSSEGLFVDRRWPSF